MSSKVINKINQTKTNQGYSTNKLRPATSCGNLSSYNSGGTSSRRGSPTRSIFGGGNKTIERVNMIDAPAPVTHRRMYNSRYHSTQPPWATDDTINPFAVDEDINGRKSRNRRARNASVPRMTHAVQTNDSLDYNDQTEMVFIPLESPKDQYRSEIKTVIDNPTLRRTTGVPVKELKRSSYQTMPNSRYNYDEIDYRSSSKPRAAQPYYTGSVDFNKVFQVKNQVNNRSDADIQARIDYWLNKNIDLQDPDSNSVSNHNRAPSTLSAPITNDNSKQHDSSNYINSTPTYRNQIQFTPRANTHFSSPKIWTKINDEESAPSPQTIEAVFLDSSSDNGDYSDHDLGTSMSAPRPTSKYNNNHHNYNNTNHHQHHPTGGHFTIQANLSAKSSPRSSPIKKPIPTPRSVMSQACQVCQHFLDQSDQVNLTGGFKVHRACFKCFWCKTKLNVDTWKMSGDKLCCPLHYRVM